MDRRSLLRVTMTGVGGLAAARLAACAAPLPAGSVDPDGFDCGVASGIHNGNAAVLWTRFAPAAAGAVELRWVVATDPELTLPVRSGVVVAEPESDGCAKVLAEGLDPGQTYWYRFSVEGRHSPVGRTRTPGGDGTDVARFAVASCQQFNAGYFSAWQAIAQSDVDAVIHLGDYIYESGGGSWPTAVRRDPIGTAETLEDYRAKYRLYRADPDLRAAHATHAFIPVWDDHEFVNDCHRATHLEQPERGTAAYRAWWEYQPVMRISGDRIYRGARWGRLVDLSMLDTRQYRDAPVLDEFGNSIFVGDSSSPPLSKVHDPGRTLLGPDQRAWLFDRLGAAQDDGVRWKVLGNQVMISPLRLLNFDLPELRELNDSLPKNSGLFINFDDWNGFFAERDRLTAHLLDAGVADVAVFTGDVHQFFQAPVRRELDGPVVAQEYVCGSVSSRGADYAGPLAAELAAGVRRLDAGFRYVDLEHRGFGLVECRDDSMTVDFVTVDALSKNTDSAAARRRRRVRFQTPAGADRPVLTRT